MPSSPTQRTLKHYRDEGYAVGICEKWNAYAKIRQDLFGFIDCVALHPVEGIIAIQACAGSSHAVRRQKILAEPNAELWLRSGGRIQVVSWAKRGGRGIRKTWTPRVEEINLQDVVAGRP